MARTREWGVSPRPRWKDEQWACCLACMFFADWAGSFGFFARFGSEKHSRARKIQNQRFLRKQQYRTPQARFSALHYCFFFSLFSFQYRLDVGSTPNPQSMSVQYKFPSSEFPAHFSRPSLWKSKKSSGGDVWLASFASNVVDFFFFFSLVWGFFKAEISDWGVGSWWVKWWIRQVFFGGVGLFHSTLGIWLFFFFGSCFWGVHSLPGLFVSAGLFDSAIIMSTISSFRFKHLLVNDRFLVWNRHKNPMRQVNFVLEKSRTNVFFSRAISFIEAHFSTGVEQSPVFILFSPLVLDTSVWAPILSSVLVVFLHTVPLQLGSSSSNCSIISIELGFFGSEWNLDFEP